MTEGQPPRSPASLPCPHTSLTIVTTARMKFGIPADRRQHLQANLDALCEAVVAAVSGPARTLPQLITMKGDREAWLAAGRVPLHRTGDLLADVIALADYASAPIYAAIDSLAARPQGTATPDAWAVVDATGKFLKIDADREYIDGECETFNRYKTAVHSVYGLVEKPCTVEPLYRASPPSPGVSLEQDK